MDLGEMLAQVDDLDTVVRALAREQVIRDVMARSGEAREHVADLADAVDSMDQEAVLDLTGGEPTTLRDAVSRYVESLEEMGTTEALDTAANLTTILDYPWSAEEERVSLHSNPSLKLEAGYPEDDEHLVITLGGHQVFTSSYDQIGWSGMEAVQSAVEAVHRAVLARVVPDRDHHVQLTSTERRSLLAWLEGPNGSWAAETRSRVTVDAVEGGGVLVRTRPYVYQQLPRTQV